MIIEKIVVGKFGVNCYFIMDEVTKEAIVIDPGDQAPLIMRTVDKHAAKVKYIVLTHGHGDHIAGVLPLKALTQAEIIASEDEVDMLMNPEYNESIRIGDEAVSFEADVYVRDMDVLVCGSLNFKCIKTPGHTKGGMCILVDKYLFSGDTLFNRSVGRTDLYGGNHQTLISSVAFKLLVLDDDVVVYPGHGPKTTIGFERVNNPFI